MEKPEYNDSKGEYVVRSEADGMPYAVDLYANKGRGSCTCPDYTCRRHKRLDEEMNPNEKMLPYHCKHLHAALLEFSTRIIPVLASKHEEQ